MRIVVIALAVVLLLTAPALAEKDTFSAKASLQHKGADAQGRQIIAGTVTSPGFGKGTLTLRATPKADGSLNGPFTMKFEFGSITGTTQSQLTADPAVGNRVLGTGKITGGTRAYKNGKGRFTITGTDSSAGVVKLTLKGDVEFPTR
jgi:hypothetical protein